MTDESNNEPAQKMRRLLKGGKISVISKLPKKDASAPPFLPKLEEKKVAPPQKNSPPPSKPKRKSPPLSMPKLALKPKGKKLNFGPPFWTIASTLSLTINLILVIVLVVLLVGLRRSGLQLSAVTKMGTNLLGGLYGNFEKMDRAHITTNVQVNTTIPVKFDLQLNQQTSVVLSQDVTINNAAVTVKTGGLNISNAITTIVLPQGTTLPIVLNLTVPVDTSVPITLDVPVDIPLNQTQLHEPFTGLQGVVQPFYCLIDGNAVNLDGQPICK